MQIERINDFKESHLEKLVDTYFETTPPEQYCEYAFAKALGICHSQLFAYRQKPHHAKIIKEAKKRILLNRQANRLIWHANEDWV